MLLRKSAKQQCLNDISVKLPRLIPAAGINISYNSQLQLAEMIRQNVEHKYFPSGADVFVQIIAFPIGLLAMALGPYAVSIDPNCGNPELTGIPRNKLTALDNLVFTEVLSNYRDIEEENRIAIEAQNRRDQRTNANPPALTFGRDLANERQELDQRKEELKEEREQLDNSYTGKVLKFIFG